MKHVATGNPSLSTIIQMIEESILDELFYPLIFLISFASERKDTVNPIMLKNIFTLIEIIGIRVPSAMIFADLLGFRVNAAPSTHFLQRMFSLLKFRVSNITFHIQLVCYCGAMMRWPTLYAVDTSVKNMVPSMYFVADNAEFNQFLSIQIRRFFLQHYPIEAFELFYGLPHSNTIITRILCSLLDEMTSIQSATHQQLIYSFSYLFLYVNSIAYQGHLDGQYFAMHMRTRPYHSPFALLALVNHINPLIYLYNLLIPQALLSVPNITPEQAREIVLEAYPIFDMSSDTSMNELIDRIPDFVAKFFLPHLHYGQMRQPNTFSDLIILTQLAASNNIERFKIIFNFLKSPLTDRLLLLSLPHSALSKMAIQIHRALLAHPKPDFPLNFYQTMFDYYMFTAPAIQPTFIDLPKNLDITLPALKLMVKYCRTFVINDRLNKGIIIYLLSVSKLSPECARIARVLLFKIYLSSVIILDESVVNGLFECDDPYIQLVFAIHLDIDRPDSIYEWRPKTRETHVELLKLLPFTMNGESISDFRESSDPNIQMAAQFLNTRPADMVERVKSSPNPELMLFLLSMTSVIAIDQVAKSLVSIAEWAMSQFSTELHDIGLPEFSFIPVCILFIRLMDTSQVELAESVLKYIINFAIGDNTILITCYRLIRHEYHRLNEPLTKLFLAAITRSDFYVDHETLPQLIMRGAEADLKLINDASSMAHEFQTDYQCILYYATCTFLLKGYDVADLVNIIYDINSDKRIIRSQFHFVVELVGHLLPENGLRFFNELISRPHFEFSIRTGRNFCYFAPPAALELIYHQAEKIIMKNADRARAYLEMAFPSVFRMNSKPQAVAEMLHGILMSIQPDFPRSTMETLVDMIGVTFDALKLQKYRSLLIGENNLPADLRQSLALSLVVSGNYHVFNDDYNVKLQYS